MANAYLNTLFHPGAGKERYVKHSELQDVKGESEASDGFAGCGHSNESNKPHTSLFGKSGYFYVKASPQIRFEKMTARILHQSRRLKEAPLLLCRITK